MATALFDQVQNELREPRGMEHPTGSESASLTEHSYLASEASNEALIDEAFRTFTGPDARRYMPPECLDLEVRCIVASGQSVLGYGRGMLEAVDIANRRGFDMGAYAVIFINQPPEINW